MKSFESLKFYLRLLGLWKSDTEKHDLILNIMFFVFFFNFFVTSFWFFAFEAQNFIEYSKSFYYMTSALLSLSWYSIYIYQKISYAQVFSDLDQMIQKSTSLG